MRKILAGLTLLTVVALGVGLVCSCCPAYANESSPNSKISAPGCGCCGKTLQLPSRDRATQQTERAILSNSLLGLLSFFIASQVGAGLFEQPGISRSVHSPPVDSSNLPLYLSLEVLRL